jgi:hypothetical protein
MPPFALLPPPIDQYRCRQLRRDFTPVIDDFTQAATSHEPAGGKTLLSMTGASFCITKSLTLFEPLAKFSSPWVK